MPQFAYRARTQQGQLQTGRMEGASVDAVASGLARSGLIPVSIDPVRELAAGGSLGQVFAERINALDIMMFCRQMASMLKAGVPIMRALASLAESSSKPAWRAMLEDVREQLASGRELSVCLGKYPRIFTGFFLSMVRVGESTGKLDLLFMRLFHHMEFERDMHRHVQSALRYPSFVIVAMAIAIVVINVMVIPTFAKVYKSAGADLPIFTQLLIAFSNWMVAWWPILLGAVVAGVLGFRWWVNRQEGRYTWHRLLLRLPVVGKIVHKAALSRFSRGLAMTYSSGLPIVQGLTATAQVVENDYIAAQVERIRDNVQRGESLARSAAATGAFTPMVLQMLAVGEETGDLERLLAEIAEMYQGEVEYDIKTLSEQIEPLLLVALAGLVLVLALGVFLPIWDLGQAMMHKKG